MEKNNTKNTKNTKNIVIGIVSIFAIILAIILLSGGSNTTSNSIEGKSLDSISLETLIDDDSIKGDPDAPVTVIEFSDYECPFCQRFYQTTYSLIEENYIDTGKVNFVYRDFPLNFHKNAQKAAEAAECAGEQGQYYEMHDKLFEEGVEGGVNSFKQYASDIGLDRGEFDVCLDTGSMRNEVQQDLADGQALGVSGTPSFIINGKMVVGAQPYDVIAREIENAL
jgi:protein-disulfide isomerase